MSQKVSAEVFGKLSRLVAGDSIHFKSVVDRKAVDCVVVVLCGGAKDKMILSEPSQNPSYIPDGNGWWTTSNQSGLVNIGRDSICTINWEVDTINVVAGGGAEEAKAYIKLVNDMENFSQVVSDTTASLKMGGSSADFVLAEKFCKDMEVAHGEGDITTISMSVWLVNKLPDLPPKAQAMVLTMIMSNFCKGLWAGQNTTTRLHAQSFGHDRSVGPLQ